MTEEQRLACEDWVRRHLIEKQADQNDSFPPGMPEYVAEQAKEFVDRLRKVNP